MAEADWQRLKLPSDAPFLSARVSLCCVPRTAIYGANGMWTDDTLPSSRSLAENDTSVGFFSDGNHLFIDNAVEGSLQMINSLVRKSSEIVRDYEGQGFAEMELEENPVIQHFPDQDDQDNDIFSSVESIGSVS